MFYNVSEIKILTKLSAKIPPKSVSEQLNFTGGQGRRERGFQGFQETP